MHTADGIEALRDVVRGAVTLPGEDGWDAARRAFNLAVDQQPAAVVEVQAAFDVVAAVRFAAAHGLGVTAQPTGHGATHDLRDTIVLRTGALRAIYVDREGARVVAGAGVRWGDLLARTGRDGLAGLSGSSPGVGVVGYCLGGGLGWLGRRYGLAADSVLAIELVTPDGELVIVDAESDPELFWALRGGGGSFGIVTAIELALQPVPSVFGGRLVWPGEQAQTVLNAWRRWTAGVPEELSSTATVMQVPPLPTVPEPLRGRHLVTIAIAHQGDEAQAREELAPLLEQTGAPMIEQLATLPIADLGEIAQDPADPAPSALAAELLDDVTPATIDAILSQVGAGSGSPLVLAQLRHLGGALARRTPGQGVAGAVAAPYLVYGVGVTPTPAAAAAVAAGLRGLLAAVAPWGTGRRPLNFAADGELATVFAAADLARLSALRTERDPRDVIRANHRIPLAAAPLAQAA